MSIARRLSFAASSVLALSLLSAPAWAAPAKIYGLVIGIDDYVGEANDLNGAVNDADDIVASLRSSGAVEIVRLVDSEATKQSIEGAWFRLLDQAEKGDTLVFSFAGHGSQEPEPPGRHDEEDGRNENFLLAAYAPSGDGTKQRILDDEVFEWLKGADQKGVSVIFIADSCHSGGMSRSARADGVRFRNGNFGQIRDDLLNFPSPEIAKLTEADFELATFVAATSEDRLTPEVMIDGKKRGALSWAFARALEGKADKNADGQIDQLELLSFLVPAVHAQVESQQTPQVLPLRAASRALFGAPATEDGAGEISEPPSSVEAEPGEDAVAAEASKLQLLVEGDAPPEIAALPFVNVVKEKGKHDVIWIPATGTVEHVLGGVVAENVDAAKLPPVLSKWAALKLLKSIAASDPAEAQVLSGDQRYAKGEIIRVSIKGAKHPMMTLFNLPPDGRVELFIPDPRRPAEALTDWRGKEFAEQFKVDRPPYGAEHMVAIFSEEPLAELHAALLGMGRAEGAAALRAALERTMPKDVQVGILDIYTSGAK